MKFERQFDRLFQVEVERPTASVNKERQAIGSRADLRRRGQRFKIDALNLERPNASNEAMNAAYDKTLGLVFREAKGDELPVGSSDDFKREAERMAQKAESNESIFPNLSAYCYAQAAKLNEAAGGDFQGLMLNAKRCQEESADIPKISPASLLPDAMLLGMQVRQVKKTEMPSKEEMAKIIAEDPKLLYDYALVLPEAERAEFLVLIPEEKRQLVSRALDVSVSEVLHQSIVEKRSEEDMQRSRVRGRLFGEMKSVIDQGNTEDRQIAKVLAQSVGELGEDTRQLLLEIMREETESVKIESESDTVKEDYLPRVIKVFLDNFDDWRGNDVVLKLAGDKNVDRHMAAYLLKKLIRNGYVPQDVEVWQNERKTQGQKGIEGEKHNLAIIQSVISDLGVVPSRDILNFVANDRQWKNAPLADRIENIKSSQEAFTGIEDNHELARRLNKNERDAMVYYLLHAGDDRFNLINNYGFDKFKEMVGLIDDLKIHPRPLEKFQKALATGGMENKQTLDILKKLEIGKYPLENTSQARQEISFDVSENAAVKNANFEIGRVLGRQQLGVTLLFPLYREYLEQDESDQAQKFIERMKNAQTFSDRLALIDEMEAAYPEMRTKATDELRENWRVLGEKMVLDLPLDQVLGEESVTVRGEELLPRLDGKRIDLKRIKKDLLVILKGGNKQVSAIQKELSRKRKARQKLVDGLDRQMDEQQREALEKKIRNIEVEMRDLEHERSVIGDQKTMERFSHLSDQEKKDEVEKLGNEILALTEKSPSAIFTYITMQVLGEERLRENDIALIQEMESHLQGPFQSIVDATTYQKPLVGREEKKRMRISLEYLDKTDRFINMVRFADSKICCFSSNNYEQTIQHSTANKYWVASINADPLSFVLSMEMPSAVTEENDDRRSKTQAKENLGFIFGNYAIDENGNPAIMLNGIYYAPGLENRQQVEAILSGVEKIFDGLPIRTMAIAERYGGSLGKEKAPEGYVNDPISLTRLRALDDGYGNPETKIYDDLNTGNDLNKPHDYGGNVWHKVMK